MVQGSPTQAARSHITRVVNTLPALRVRLRKSQRILEQLAREYRGHPLSWEIKRTSQDLSRALESVRDIDETASKVVNDLQRIERESRRRMT